MPARQIFYEGQRFGMLTIIREVEPNVTPCGTVQRKFAVRCDCGKELIVTRPTLVSGAKQSCGCNYVTWARKYTDEERESFLYTTWSGMKQRCYNPNAESYPNYGGRGIKICDEWKTDYKAFFEWATTHGANKSLTIDRIDVNGDYEPSNCRWVGNQVQMRNRQYNRYLEYNGERKLMKEWSEELGIPYDTIRARLDQHGYTIGQALGFEYYEPKTRPERPETRKAVLQFSLDGEFIREWDSIYDIQKALGIASKSVRTCCSGISFSSHGFVWKYKDSPKKKTEAQKKFIKTVLQYALDGTFIREWESARVAGKALGITPNGIAVMCGANKKNRKHCGGYIWRYKGDNRPIMPVSDKLINEIWEHDGESKTVREWAMQIGERPQVLYNRVQRGWTIPEALGFKHHFRGGSSTSKLILQIDKDENIVREWTSLHYIRKELGRSKPQIRKCLESGNPDSHGFYWRFKANNDD